MLPAHLLGYEGLQQLLVCGQLEPLLVGGGGGQKSDLVAGGRRQHHIPADALQHRAPLGRVLRNAGHLHKQAELV